MEHTNIAVVAIGGNFLSAGKDSAGKQMENAAKAAALIKILVNQNFNVVVVHGNGPQVGTMYLRQLVGQKEDIPPLNLALCDALTQAEIGTMLELAIINAINREKPDFQVLTIISQVEVDINDPAFQNPTKPIGPFYHESELIELKQKFPDWVFINDSGRGFRRVVPSPKPINVFSASSIPDAFKTAQVIIAGGGGGIPVFRKDDQTFELIDCVIDKDRTAALIAIKIHASHFFLLTGIDHVYLNFNTTNEKKLTNVELADAQHYMADGHFPLGSMGPKIETAIQFVEKTDGTAFITNADNLSAALDRKYGTIIFKK
jgi:carbamate kinase